MLPIVTIVGRENVGKSTLFNRLVGKRSAITYREPGITRDRNIKEINLDETSILLVDTGGYWPSAQGIKAKVKEQIEISLKSADLVLFVVDAKDGITPLDSEFADFIRKLNKKVFLVVNKIDTGQKSSLAFEFHKLGFAEVFPVSAIHRVGIEMLIQKIKENVGIHKSSNKKVPLVAILGRPNVGKSTYINAVLKERRMIVDETPGTTVDSIDVTLNYNGQELTLIDTPGLRKRTKTKTDVEYYSSVRTRLSIARCNVAMLIVDASLPITHQDKRIISTLIEEGKGIVIAVNKIDLGVVFRETSLRFAKFIPITYISALHCDRVYEPIKEAIKVWEAGRQKVSSKKLNELQELKSKLKISKIVQVRIEPPTFKIKSPHPLTPQTNRFVEKTLRSAFGFIGTPIKVIT